MEANKLLTAYSFLASLCNGGKNIYDTVYVPICKRALSFWAKEQKEGSVGDIQTVIDSQYGIKIPIVLLKRLIIKVKKGLSRSQKEKFSFDYDEEKGTFSFVDFKYDEIEEKYLDQERDVNLLQKEFEDYAKSDEELAPFSDFVSRNAKLVATFLSGSEKDIVAPEASFLVHVDFLQFIKTYRTDLYAIVKRVFAGAIIASYLEANVELDAKLDSGIVYYLDTKAILQALDLQGEEDYKTVSELFDLIRKTGGKIKILNITLEEVSHLISSAMQNPQGDSEIALACARSTMWRPDKLMIFNAKIEDEIVKKLNVEIESIPAADYENYIHSDDAEELINLWAKKLGAKHDVAAYLYIRAKRAKYPGNENFIQKIHYWFVSPNDRLYSFNRRHKCSNFTEIIQPNALTSLLFLNNPSKFISDKISISISELMAKTISEETPSMELISDFAKAIEVVEGVKEEDYNALLQEASKMSTSKLESMIDESVSAPTAFKESISEVIHKAKTEQESILRLKDKEIENKSTQLSLYKEKGKISDELKDLKSEYRSINEERNKVFKPVPYKPFYIVSVIILVISIVGIGVVSYLVYKKGNITPWWFSLPGFFLTISVALASFGHHFDGPQDHRKKIATEKWGKENPQKKERLSILEGFIEEKERRLEEIEKELCKQD